MEGKDPGSDGEAFRALFEPSDRLYVDRDVCQRILADHQSLSKRIGCDSHGRRNFVGQATVCVTHQEGHRDLHDRSMIVSGG